MNSFLGNLIDRHNNNNDSREFIQIVQPRPKARFETEHMTTNEPDNDQGNDNSISQKLKPDSVTKPLLSQQPSIEIETLTADKTSPTRRQPSQIEERRSLDYQQGQRLEAVAINSEDVSNKSFSLEGKLDNRIQEVLQNLKNKHPAHSEMNSELEQSGSLQIPGWLSEVQVGFNNRLSETNSKSEAEPVVNVTIGRVEVKAVQTDSRQQPTKQKKPNGVMSLDDYLKQRGRA